MKLLYSALFLGCLWFGSYAQKTIDGPCSPVDLSYKVLIRKSFQDNNPDLKFSPRALKSSEVCFIKSIQTETEIVVHVLDERHEVIIYPYNINEIE